MTQTLAIPQDEVLTAKQERFARLFAAGHTAADAYRTAYDTKGHATTVCPEASKLLAYPKVAARVSGLRKHLAVLAAILTPIASQSGESARDAQIRQDAGTIEGVVENVFSERQSNAEVVSPESVTTNINADTPGQNTQNTSSSVYTSEFPTSGSETDNIVVGLVLVDSDSTTLISLT